MIKSNNKQDTPKSSIIQDMHALLEDNFSYEPPELVDFNQGWDTLQSLGSLITKALTSDEINNNNKEFGRFVEKSIRYFVNETIKVQTISNTKLYLHKSNGPRSLNHIQNQLLIFAQENDRLIKKIKELNQELVEKEKILSENQVKEANTNITEQSNTTDKLKQQFQSSVAENQKLYNIVKKKDLQIEKAKHNITLQRSKIAELENQIKELKQNTPVKSQQSFPRSTSLNTIHPDSPQSKSITVELPNDVSTSFSYEQEAMDSISKIDAQINEQQEEIDRANALIGKFNETIMEDEDLLNEHEKQLKEFANEAGCLEFDLFSMDKTLAQISKSNKLYQIDNERLKSLLDEIRSAVGNELPLESIPKRIMELRKKNRTLNSENENQTKKLVSSLVLFLTKLLEGADNATFGESLILTQNKDVKAKIKDAIEKCLSFVVSSDGFPIFESASGDEESTMAILNTLGVQYGSNVHAVMLLMSAVNGKLISMLREYKRSLQKVEELIPQKQGATVPASINSFLRTLQPLLRRMETTLVSSFQQQRSENLMQNLENYINNVDTLIKSIELDLRPHIADKKVSINEIPSQISSVLSRTQLQLEDKVSFFDSALSETRKAASKESSDLNQKIGSMTAENSQLKEEIEKLNTFNMELENTIVTLRERCESNDQKLADEKFKSDRLRVAMKSREDQFQKRTDSLLQIEKERYNEEIQRQKEVWERQRIIYESRISHLAEKLEDAKFSISDMSGAFDQTVAKQRAISSLSQLSVNAASLGAVLDKCFTVKGTWTDEKVAKAVVKLVDIVRNLEYEKLNSRF